MTAWLIRGIIVAMLFVAVLVPLHQLDLNEMKLCEVALCLFAYGAALVLKWTETK